MYSKTPITESQNSYKKNSSKKLDQRNEVVNTSMKIIKNSIPNQTIFPWDGQKKSFSKNTKNQKANHLLILGVRGGEGGRIIKPNHI